MATAAPVPAAAPHGAVVGDAAPALDELEGDNDGVDERWPFRLGTDGEATQASPAYVILRMCHLIGEMNGKRGELEVALESELDAVMAFPFERDGVAAYAAGVPFMEAQHGRLCALPTFLAPS